MISGVIGVIDSGIGGLSVLKELVGALSGETFVYMGDNENVPYGDKSDRRLLSLVNDLTAVLSEYKPKCLILACNTLSLTVREKLEEIIGVPVFGVFPPVEKAQMRGDRVLLIATGRTCGKYKNYQGISVMPCNTLAGEIEKNKFALNNIDLDLIFNEKAIGVDTVILGCTHYEFIKNEILDHFCAKTSLSGAVDTVKVVKAWLKGCKKSKKVSKNQIIFVGSSAKNNKKFWQEVVYKCKNSKKNRRNNKKILKSG